MRSPLTTVSESCINLHVIVNYINYSLTNHVIVNYINYCKQDHGLWL